MRVGGIGSVRLGGGYGGEQLEFFRPQLYLLGDKTGHVLGTAKGCTEMWVALTCYLYIGVTKEGDRRRFMFLLDDEPGLRGVRVVTKAWSQTDDLIPPSAKVSNLPGTGSIVSIPRLLQGGGELLDQGHIS